MALGTERRKVRTTEQFRRSNTLDAVFGYAPFLEQVEILPGLAVVLESKQYVIRPEHRAGWISVQIGDKRCKVAFRLITGWSREMLKCLVTSHLASRLMRTLHPLFMAAKVKGLIEYFRIDGMFFDKVKGLDTEFHVY